MVRRVLSVLLLSLLASVQPAWAGHGTIEETDSAIIVEYFGDDTGKTEAAASQVVASNTVREDTISEADKAEYARRDGVIAEYFEKRNEYRRLAGDDKPPQRSSRSRVRSTALPGANPE